MAHKKQQQKPGSKKQASAPLPQEDNGQLQQQLDQYPQVAQAIRKGKDHLEVESALASINNLPEATQLAFLKALAKENTVDAADVLLAVNTFGEVKELRKEARRSLIRLEASKVYPGWTPPAVALEPVMEISTTPPRFYKGFYTDTQDTGEIQLLLLWEQGAGYKDMRIMGFLLDFLNEGIKDFFTEVGNRRHVEGHVDQMRSQFVGIDLIDCTLAEGRRLLQDALDINQKSGTRPGKDYTRNLSLIRQMVLDAVVQTTDVADEVDEEDTEDEALMPEEVVTSFLEYWADQEFGDAYDLLASNSPLREGLSREAWIESREAWAKQFQPANVKTHEQYDLEGGLGKLSALMVGADQVEASEEESASIFWSVELSKAPASAALSELPVATVAYPAIKRYWFWSTYTLVMEDEEWFIDTMIDEGVKALQLPVEELQQKMNDLKEQATSLAPETDEDEEVEVEEEVAEEGEDEENEEDDDLGNFDPQELINFQELLRITNEGMHYNDAIIAQSPDDLSAYELAMSQAVSVEDFERAAAYLQLIADHFPEQRAEALRNLASILITTLTSNDDDEDEEVTYQFIDLAEQALRDALAVDGENVTGHTLLANILLAQNKQVDEAEKLLLHAQQLATEDADKVGIELGLGQLSILRDDYKAALLHYQRAAELNPELPEVWYRIGSLQQENNQLDEATQSYLRSIQTEPGLTDAYVSLAQIYLEQEEVTKAQELLEEGLDANPDAADLHAARALVLIDEGDLRSAEEALDTAEGIDEDLELVQEARSALNEARAKQRRVSSPKPKQHKPKKR